jgi:hypothetical protein
VHLDGVRAVAIPEDQQLALAAQPMLGLDQALAHRLVHEAARILRVQPHAGEVGARRVAQVDDRVGRDRLDVDQAGGFRLC